MAFSRFLFVGCTSRRFQILITFFKSVNDLLLLASSHLRHFKVKLLSLFSKETLTSLSSIGEHLTAFTSKLRVTDSITFLEYSTLKLILLSILSFLKAELFRQLIFNAKDWFLHINGSILLQEIVILHGPLQQVPKPVIGIFDGLLHVTHNFLSTLFKCTGSNQN